MKCPNCGNPSLNKLDESTFFCNRCRQQVIIEKNVDKPKEMTNFDSIIHSIIRIKTEKSTGTGFIVSSMGHVITNSHVLDGEIFAYGYIGDSDIQIELEVLEDGTENDLDLCLLQIISDKEFIPLSLSDKQPRLGETVFTIGNPKNIGISISKGSISRMTEYMFQLDLTLNKGNSGGPVINNEGEVIGVISFSIKDLQGMGFAIPTKIVKEFIKDDLMEE